MAVAVKNTPDVRTPSLFDRMPIVSLIGAVYVIVCLAVLGKALPYLWWEIIGFDENSMMYAVLFLMVLAAAAVGLGFVGLRLLGTHAPVGTRAGIFVAVLGILLILLLTRWASLWIEYWVYVGHYFSPTVGAALTAAVGLALLGVGGYYFLDRRFEPYLIQLDEQGWFSATPYKGLQGQRVRRGTILGVLVIVGAGIYALVSRGTLQRGPADWEINVPYTGRAMITNDTRGDADAALAKGFPDAWDADKRELKQPVWMSRYDLRDINEDLSHKVRIRSRNDSLLPGIDPTNVVSEADFKAAEAAIGTGETPPTKTPLNPAGGDEVSNYVKIHNPGDSSFGVNTVVKKTDFEAEVQRLRGTTPGTEGAANQPPATNKKLPTAVPVALASGTEVYQSLTILPSLQYTLPLLLIAGTLWLSWRVVNYPAFADFLIATEAELNKVSWTTRRKLMQDTVVVLATVFLMAVFLFAMDQAWSHLLSWKQIGVIQLPQDSGEAKKTIENRPW